MTETDHPKALSAGAALIAAHSLTAARASAPASPFSPEARSARLMLRTRTAAAASPDFVNLITG